MTAHPLTGEAIFAAENGVVTWQHADMTPPAGFVIVFSTRLALSPQGPAFINYGYYGMAGDPAVARRSLCEAFGLDFARLTLGEQVHGVNVEIVDHARAGRNTPQDRLPATDALVTGLPDTPLAVVTADCVPVLFADTRTGAVAAAHAGWRSAVAGILEKTVETMRDSFGSRPEDLRVFMGPSISGRCYEVGSDLIDCLRPEDLSCLTGEGGGGKRFFDIKALNAARLAAAGVDPRHIAAAAVCTHCTTSLFFSHRGDTRLRGSNLSVIARVE